MKEESKISAGEAEERRVKLEADSKAHEEAQAKERTRGILKREGEAKYSDVGHLQVANAAKEG
jgi:hypothetical protein